MEKIKERSADRGDWQGVLLWRDIEGCGIYKSKTRYEIIICGGVIYELFTYSWRTVFF